MKCFASLTTKLPENAASVDRKISLLTAREMSLRNPSIIVLKVGPVGRIGFTDYRQESTNWGDILHTNIHVRLGVNMVVLIPFILVAASPESVSFWLLLPIFIWGFFALKQLLAFVPTGIMHIPVGPVQYLTVIVFGSLMCAVFGLVILPVFIVVDVIRLVSKR